MAFVKDRFDDAKIKEIISQLIATVSVEVGDKKANAILRKFSTLNYEKYTDNHIYWDIVQKIHYAGNVQAISATTTLRGLSDEEYFKDYSVSSKYTEDDIDLIVSLDTNRMRTKKRTAEFCVESAKIFSNILDKRKGGDKKFASFVEDLTSEFQRKPKQSHWSGPRDDAEMAKQFLTFFTNEPHKLSGLSKIGTCHFLMDLGFKIPKPDRVLTRVLYRLGLVDKENDIDGVISAIPHIADITTKTVREIDILFMRFGQSGPEDDFIIQGPCLQNNPTCCDCPISDRCLYHRGCSEASNLPQDTKQALKVFFTG